MSERTKLQSDASGILKDAQFIYERIRELRWRDGRLIDGHEGQAAGAAFDAMKECVQHLE